MEANPCTRWIFYTFISAKIILTVALILSQIPTHLCETKLAQQILRKHNIV